jgi:hypothetical protein
MRPSGVGTALTQDQLNAFFGTTPPDTAQLTHDQLNAFFGTTVANGEERHTTDDLDYLGSGRTSETITTYTGGATPKAFCSPQVCTR